DEGAAGALANRDAAHDRLPGLSRRPAACADAAALSGARRARPVAAGRGPRRNGARPKTPAIRPRDLRVAGPRISRRRQTSARPRGISEAGPGDVADLHPPPLRGG